VKSKSTYIGWGAAILSMALMGVVGSLGAQPNDRWQAGSGLQLKGNVVALTCFLETAENPWTEAEKQAMLSSLNQSQQWIGTQANKWGQSVSFQTHDLFEGQPVQIGQMPTGTGSGKERVDWVRVVVEKAGYQNARQAYKKLSKKYHNNNLYLIMFAHTDGISYAMRFARGMNKKKYLLEGALIFQRYDNGTEMPTPAIISHETLHVFGAWDLYTTYAQTADRHSKAMEIYPNDIMLRVSNQLQLLEVDKLTAWLLGWNTREDDVFEWFRPADFKR